MDLFRNISWTFTANLIVSLIKWLIIVIIARLLTLEDIGAYSLAFAIGAPITLFANMKLRSLYISEEKNSFSDYINARNLLSIFSFIVLLIIAIFIYPQYFYIILLVGAMKILDLQSDMYYSLPHKEEDMDYIGKLMVVKHLITFIGFFIVLLFTRNLILSLFIQIILQLIYLLFVEKKNILANYLSAKLNFNFKNIKKVILLGLPLGFVQMLFSFNTFYPRYLLEFFESAKILGYFSAISYILIIGNLMINAVSQSFLPLLTKKLKHKNYNSFKKILYINLSIFSLSLGLIIIVISFFFGELALELIYGKEYGSYADILLLMSISLAINLISRNFDTALLAMRYISIQPKITIIILIINIFLTYYLIENYGIYGATYSLIVINSIQLALRWIFVNYKLKKIENQILE